MYLADEAKPRFYNDQNSPQFKQVLARQLGETRFLP